MELDFDYTGNFPECMSADAGHGIKVRIMYEQDTEICDPRDCTNLGHMFVDYRGYNLGDYPGDSDYDPRDREDDDGNPIDMFEWLKQEFDARVILPLYIYDHSGLSMSCGRNMGSIDPRGVNPFDSAAWDTSMVGFIFDTKGTREECGCEKFTDEKIEEGLRAEVESYDMYLRGECFYYVIEDEDGNELDSCAGFLGDDCAREEATMSARLCVAEAEKIEHRNKLAAACWRE